MNNEIETLPLDEQFAILLHKKMMDKTGDAKRQMKKYYKDQYNKTGIIPNPLKLAEAGFLEGRICSGRKRVLSSEIIHRFTQMVIASTDKKDDRFIFITQKARIIKTYHHYLEEEFHRKISLDALVRCAKQENLNDYLKKPDFEETINVSTYFNSVEVFDLIQVDGCEFHYIKIKNDQGEWVKLIVIEYSDTESRYMFCLSAYHSENSENAILEFQSFLLCQPFPDKKIRIRPDQAGAFLNLMRPIQELNHKYSMHPDKFYLDPDYAGTYSPKHKVHLERSHRTLHHYEIRIIKHYEEKIVKTEPGILFTNNKKTEITITYLDITIDDINRSKILEIYRNEHNENSHCFSKNGQKERWIPQVKLQAWMDQQPKTITFAPKDVECCMRYAFKKKNASVSKKGTLLYDKRTFYVVIGRDKFSHQQNTPVKVSYVDNKLLLFERKQGGVWLGEAMPQQPSAEPEHVKKKAKIRVNENAVEQIATFLEKSGFQVNLMELGMRYQKGLTLSKAKEIYAKNQERYATYIYRLPSDEHAARIAMFRAFLIDCDRPLQLSEHTPYATFKGE
jgi:hypothetical protein